VSSKQISQWRSVGFAFLVVLVLATMFGLVGWGALKDPASAAQLSAMLPAIAGMYGSLCTFAGFAVAFAFGKSLGEKAVDGSGLKGMARALLTDAKPGEPPPPPTAGFARVTFLVVLAGVALLVALALLGALFWNTAP
jgi:hypothetical protein